MSTFEDLFKQLLSGTLEESIQAAYALGRLGGEAIESLIAVLKDPTKHHVWWLVVTALGRSSNKRAVEPLIEFLKNPLSSGGLLARKYTVIALGDLRDPRAVDVLIAALDEREHYEEEDGEEVTVYDEPAHEIIESAAWGLWQIGDLRAVEPIVNRLLRGDHWHDNCLAKWGEPAFERLIKAVNSANEITRSRAASLLGEFGDIRAVEPLIEVLRKDTSEKVRHSAAYGLYELRNIRGLEPLLAALQDPYQQVRLHAAWGVGYFLRLSKDEILTYEPKEDQLSVESIVERSFQSIGEKKMLKILAGALTDQTPTIKAHAAEFFGRYGLLMSRNVREAEVIPALELLLSDPDKSIRRSAQTALTYLQDHMKTDEILDS
jgi:HEAT repeat protein